ncbi:hypothetical protein GCM10009730_01650 [Streptomyces albidochromogenes]|uniref:hypothetical protein n=1 Tax=Streptomyces albidochromogenes TaxID=329524 RepID=UPI00110FA5C2|nr:hypothetical protein [Streptomyces albidochromogenes]
MATFDAPHAQPQPLTPAWLRAHFDPLPFPARRAALARYGRALAPDAYAALHAALDAGDAEERHTALFLAVVRRDTDAVRTALEDPLLRRRALSAAIRLPLPEQALTALALHDTGAVRHETFRVLRAGRRTALADALLPRVHERHGPREAARLLTACSARTAAAWLPRLEPPAGVLTSLARTAPAAVATRLADGYAAHTGPERQRFVRSHLPIATTVAERDPHAGLLLLRRAPGLIGARAAVALLRHPAGVLRVLRAATPEPGGTPRVLRFTPGPLPPSVRRAVLALPVGDRAELARRCHAAAPLRRHGGAGQVSPDALLQLLPPDARRRAVEERTASTFGRRTFLSDLAAVAALGPDDRAAFLAPWTDQLRRSGRTVRRAAAGLPLAVAEPVLREQTSDHRLHLRLFAWPALLACAELHGDPREYARIAASCERAWHDQNEVRHGALAQLAEAPPRLLAAVEERVLRDAVMTAVQSRDSTGATLAAAERWLRRTARSAASRGDDHRAAFAARLLCHVLADPRRRGPRTPLRVGARTARSVWSMVEAGERTFPGTLVSLAELLAPHLPDLPSLEALMRRTAEEHDDPEVASRAAAVWLGPPATRERRCAELVRLDPSFAAVPEVLRTLATRRTDLLDDVLGAVARDGLRGRVRPGARPWAPRLRPADTGRWLPQQRRRWSAHLAAVACDEQVPLRERADAAALVSSPDALVALAESAPHPVAAAALGSLGTLGAAGPVTAELLETLLRHAGTGGVRGRAAMTAVRRLLDAVPDGRAVTLLAPLLRNPANPVGTRKEAARALGALTGTAVLEAFLAAWDEPAQHRDVRAVIAPFLTRAVDRAEVADRLSAAMREPAVREAVLGRRSPTVPPGNRAAYTAFLGGLLRDGDDDTAVDACRALPAQAGPEGASDLARLLAEIAVDPTRAWKVWNEAVRQLVSLPLAADTPPLVTGAFRTLLLRAGSDDTQVRADALRRLDACAETLADRQDNAGARAVTDSAIDALVAAGLLRRAVALAQEAAVGAVRRADAAPEPWERLLELVADHPERLSPSGSLYLEAGRAGPVAAALVVSRTLRDHGSHAAGRLALALVSAAGRAAGWQDPWPAELAALREHPDPDTSVEAFLVVAGDVH